MAKFLSLFLSGAGVSQMTLARMMGLCPSTVSSWFQYDDIRMSRIYQAAEVLHSSVSFEMTKEGYNEKNESRSSVIIIKGCDESLKKKKWISD